MTPLGQILRKHQVSYHIYADDTQLYLSFSPNDPNSALDKLESSIDEIRSWMVANKLKLNDDKSEFIILSSKYHRAVAQKLSLIIGDETLPASSSVRNLGVIMDSVFNMESHISSVCKSCYFHLRNIGAIRRYLDTDTAAQVIHAFVTSRLDYCNSLLSGLPDKTLLRLKRVQNTAARIVSLCGKQDHITPILKQLHWLPVALRIEFKILLLTYKILNGMAPVYLCELLQLYVPCRSLRSTSQSLLVTPKSRTVSYGDRAFSIVAPKMWNNLPEHIRNSSTVSGFKTVLKTYMFDKF